MKKVLISPSILTLDFSNIQTQCAKLQRDGADWIHLDVMDGIFVPNSTFDWQLVSQVKQAVTIPLDIHLMVVDPINVVDNYAKAGADIITFHLEAAEDPQAVIDEIHKCGCKAGISIKPKTPFEDVAPYMDKVEMLLVMTVEPGFGGQKMMPETLEKVRAARRFVTEKGLATDIQVDGGVKYDNIHLPLEAGANIFVVGSAVFGDNTYGEAKRFSEYLAQQS
jgi:ribulose-phosphate 3-epimerase